MNARPLRNAYPNPQTLNPGSFETRRTPEVPSRRAFLGRSLALGVTATMPALLAGCVDDDGPQPWRDWPLERKIAQMLVVGFRGTTLDEANPIVAAIATHRIGGVILFDYDVALQRSGRNITSPAQLQALTADLAARAARAASPLFVAVDQEGGRVVRLKERYGFPATVSAQSLGTADDLGLTGQAAYGIASTLVENGLNVNFAPVVDLNVNPDNPVIGKLERSFSADPTIVVRHAGEFASVQRRTGVASALKHFPGHGSSTGDSHQGFVDVTQTWSEIELQPFHALIGRDLADMVMTAHIYNARLDATYPATLSHATITGLLRRELGYNGVVVTDDMQMGAIALHFSYPTAVLRAISAGVDIVLVANNLSYDPDVVPKTIEIVLAAVARGEIDAARIDQSCERILALKSRCGWL